MPFEVKNGDVCGCGEYNVMKDDVLCWKCRLEMNEGLESCLREMGYINNENGNWVKGE